MRVTVKMDDIEVTIDRPAFQDFKIGVFTNPSEVRGKLLEETVFPMLEKAVEKAKELHELRKI